VYELIDDLPELATIVVLGDPARPVSHRTHPRVAIVAFEEFLGEIDHAAPPDLDLLADDDATMFYTSGTTGHRNIITNFMNLSFSAHRSALRAGVTPDPTVPSVQNIGLLNVPFFHATGCYAVLVPSTAAGSKIVLMHHFDAGRALETLNANASR
jgi:long-chain acyl-CoA synthetase